ncbi:MAG: DNA-directed RNA polymerase subunit omega, partial [Myxococcales bacterium]|nr:DNA-directed RNA polymerase subunit omega [Myxococcales bacterium]
WVVLAAKRARQLVNGAPALVPSKNRPAVTALREIASQKVYFNRKTREAVEEYIAEEKIIESSQQG